MKKMIVETSGNFGLGDPQARQEIHAFRPSIVQPTQFLASRIGLGQVNILVDGLPEKANDADFLTCWNECAGDKDLALDSYQAEVCADTEVKSELDNKEETKHEAQEKENLAQQEAKKIAETAVVKKETANKKATNKKASKKT